MTASKYILLAHDFAAHSSSFVWGGAKPTNATHLRGDMIASKCILVAHDFVAHSSSIQILTKCVENVVLKNV